MLIPDSRIALRRDLHVRKVTMRIEAVETKMAMNEHEILIEDEKIESNRSLTLKR